MKDMNALIQDLKANAATRNELAAKMIATTPGQWETLRGHLRGMGYDVDVATLQRTVRDVVQRDAARTKALLHEWHLAPK